MQRDSALIFLSGIVLFTAGLGSEFVSMQARFAFFAQEMLRYGPSFFPTTYGLPYPDYPAGSTLAVYLVSLLFGRVIPFAAVLPTAAVSALILVVTYQIGAMHSRKWGLGAVLLELSTYLFLSESRSISLDQYVSLATVLSFYLVYSSGLCGGKKRLWFIPLILTAAFFFRGPIGMIIPAAVVCGYYLWRREFRNSLLMAGGTLFLLAACGTALLGAAYLQGGEDLVKRVIDAQAAGRMVDGRESCLFYWYRCLSSCAVSCPLAILVVGARFRRILKRETPDDTFLGYLACWVLIVLIGMSVPAAKKARYILPIVPALALAASWVFIDLSLKGVLAETRKAVVRICSFIPLSAGLAAVAFLVFGPLFRLHAGIHSVVAAGLLTGLAVIVWAARRRLKNYQNGDMTLMAAAVAAFIIIDAGIFEPVEIDRQRTMPFAEKLLSLQQGRPGEVVFYRIGPDGEDIKFMVNYNRPITPVFVKSPEELLGRQKDSYFIARKQDFEQLPEAIKKQMNLCFQGRIGHKDCVVFTFQDFGPNKPIGMRTGVREAGAASAPQESKR